MMGMGGVMRPVAACPLPRRAALGVVAGALVLGRWPGLARAAALPESRAFRVYREGEEIGRHDYVFTPTADGFTVDSHVELVVKVAFITAFRYEQRGRDVWVGEKMVASDIVTDDDGERTRLQARAAGEALLVDGATGEVKAPLGTMTDVSFWNDAIVRARELIDSKTGELGPLQVRGRASERIVVRGEEIAAAGYTIESSRGRSGQIWYDHDGNWVKARLVTRGETLEYELI